MSSITEIIASQGISIINSDELNCRSCQQEYLIKRYEYNKDCNNRNCENPSDLMVKGWVQPYKPEMNMMSMDEYGTKLNNMIVLVYYPNESIELQQLPCQDKIIYEGKQYKLVLNQCMNQACYSECGGRLCKAVFCLENCVESEPSSREITNVVD